MCRSVTFERQIYTLHQTSVHVLAESERWYLRNCVAAVQNHISPKLLQALKELSAFDETQCEYLRMPLSRNKSTLESSRSYLIGTISNKEYRSRLQYIHEKLLQVRSIITKLYGELNNDHLSLLDCDISAFAHKFLADQATHVG